MTLPFIRKSMQRNSSWPGDSTLHTKAEYICADLSLHSSLFPLQSKGGPYISGRFNSNQGEDHIKGMAIAKTRRSSDYKK
jgi:hypothetical protein